MNALRQATLLLVMAFVPAVAMNQDLQAPSVTLQGATIKIDGQFAHIQGEMPAKMGPWFYHVEQKTPNLFVYSFWTIGEFQDTREKNHGLYEAKSWTVEVLDSKNDPETKLIFDKLDDFLFWGDLVIGAGKAQVMIKSIDGLPESSCGPVSLQILK